MRLFLSLVFLILTICAKAGFVNREQARAKAHHFLMEKGRNRQLMDAETRTKAVRSRGMALPDYYYVFNADGEQGFVIVLKDLSMPMRCRRIWLHGFKDMKIRSSIFRRMTVNLC